MDLQKEWETLSSEFTANQNDEFTTNNEIRKESKGIYETMYRNLNYKMMFLRIFSITALLLSILSTGTLRYFFIAFFIAYEAARMLMIHLMKKLPPAINYNEMTKDVLSVLLSVIQSILKLERLWGYIFIPLAGPAGLIMAKLFFGKSLSEIINSPDFIYHLLICLLIAPVAIILAGKMNKYAFSKHLFKISENLRQLEN